MQPNTPIPNCSFHGSQMSWKEGVSKTTNKPYGFWACSEKVNGQFCKAKPVMPQNIVTIDHQAGTPLPPFTTHQGPVNVPQEPSRLGRAMELLEELNYELQMAADEQKRNG